jgi:Holliday junction resolvase-like predicted endonuclease
LTVANYSRGRAFEYKVRDWLKENYCDIVIRSAGSKGEFDLVGIHYNTGQVRLVSCRNSKRWSGIEKQRLNMIQKKLKTNFIVMRVYKDESTKKIMWEGIA